MSIVTISEAMLGRAVARDGRILRDRVLSGFCVRLNARKRTFIVATDLPTLRAAHLAYCTAKGIKASSRKRYESLFRTHFGDWLDEPATVLGQGGFAEHCAGFAQSSSEIGFVPYSTA